jgi:RNA recognition motif-containing protein
MNSDLNSLKSKSSKEERMGKKLFVGNLPYTASDADLADAFAAYGTVESARVIVDRDSGRSKGFGFVEMATDAEAVEATSKLNGADWGGRSMTVNEAKPMAPREDRGGRGGGGGGNRSWGSR